MFDVVELCGSLSNANLSIEDIHGKNVLTILVDLCALDSDNTGECRVGTCDGTTFCSVR